MTPPPFHIYFIYFLFCSFYCFALSALFKENINRSPREVVKYLGERASLVGRLHLPVPLSFALYITTYFYIYLVENECPTCVSTSDFEVLFDQNIDCFTFRKYRLYY